MKRCSSCGAVQSDSRTVCIDCGARLGAPVSSDEEAAINEATLDKIDRAGERTELFYTPLILRIFGFVSAAAMAALVILLCITSSRAGSVRREMEDRMDALGVVTDGSGDIVFADGSTEHSVLLEYPEKIDELEEISMAALGSLVLLIIPTLIFLFPKAIWSLDTLVMRNVYGVGAEPTFIWVTAARVVSVIMFALGAAGTVYSIIAFARL